MYFIAQIISVTIDGGQALLSTTLTSDMSRTEVSNLPVVSTDGFQSSGILRVGEEVITYQSKSATAFLSLSRGQGQTDTSGHRSGTRVFDETSGTLNSGITFKAAETLSEGGTFSVLIAGKDFIIHDFPQMLTWDYSFLQGDVYGFPLIYFRSIGSAMSIGVMLFLLANMSAAFQSVFLRTF